MYNYDNKKDAYYKKNRSIIIKESFNKKIKVIFSQHCSSCEILQHSLF
jgi:hypothetical protein